MPQERGWYLHGGDYNELWAKLRGRFAEFAREARGLEEVHRGELEALRFLETGDPGPPGPGEARGGGVGPPAG